MTDYVFDLNDPDIKEKLNQNKLIKLNKANNQLIIEFDNCVDGSVSYEKTGNNIVLSISNNEGFLGNITLQNIATKDVAGNSNSFVNLIYSYTAETEKLDETVKLLEQVYDMDYSSATKAQTIKGTYLNENITGGQNNDKIYGTNGTNTINGLTGADKIYSGEGADTIKVYNRQSPIYNGDILYSSDKNDSVEFYTGEENYDRNVKFLKKGNDLVLLGISEAPSDASRVEKYADRITISDYYKQTESERINKFSIAKVPETDPDSGKEIPPVKTDVPLPTDIYSLVEGKGTINAYENDTVIATAKSKINLALGVNEVYGSSANDTININADGTKTFYLWDNFGSDAYNISSNDAIVKFDTVYSNEGYSTGRSYEKSGNNLIASLSYGYSELGKITINNYFKDGSDYDVRFNGTNLTDELATTFIKITGNEKNANTLIGTKYKDIINGGNKNDNITTGKGDDIVYFGKGNDIVTVDGDGNKSFYLVNGDGNKTIVNYASATINITTSGYAEYVENTILGYSKDDRNGKLYAFDPTSFNVDSITMENYYDESGVITKSAMCNYNNIENFTLFSTGSNQTIEDYYNRYIVVGTTKKDNISVTDIGGSIYAGKGDDTINATVVNYNDCSIYAGEGKDRINLKESGVYTLYTNNGDGNDTVNISSDSTVRMNFTGQNLDGFSYRKSGNDLLIDRSYLNAKNKTVAETMTVEGYFSATSQNIKLYDNNETIPEEDKWVDIKDNINANTLNILNTYDKKAKQYIYCGTDFNDMITGTKKVDNITTENGSDKINAGKGNDIITLTGSGTKDIIIANGDGTDTIKFAENTDGIANLIFNKCDAVYYKQEENNLNISRVYINGSTVSEEHTIIEDYFTAEGTVNPNLDERIMVDGVVFDPNKFPTKYNNYSKDKRYNYDLEDPGSITLTTSKADTITVNSGNYELLSGAGNDSITLKSGISKVVAGAGNDTITVQEGANANLYFQTGDGNDTLIFENSNNHYANIYVNSASPEKTTFNKKEDDLIVSRLNGKKTESLTVSNFFGSNNITGELKIELENYNNLTEIETVINEFGLNIQGVTENNLTTYIGADGYDNYYSYSGKGNAEMIGSKTGEDTYNVTLNKNSALTISDRGGDDDVLNLNAKTSNIKIFFNVEKESGSVKGGLYVYDKSALNTNNVKSALSGTVKGAVALDDYFASESSGKIENIYTTTDTIDMDRWVNDVKNSVVSWLSYHNYSSVAEVINSNQSQDITEILAYYQNADASIIN